MAPFYCLLHIVKAQKNDISILRFVFKNSINKGNSLSLMLFVLDFVNALCVFG